MRRFRWFSVLRASPTLGLPILAACGGVPSTFVDLSAELPAAWLDDGVQDGHGGVPLVVDPDLKDGVTALADCAATVSVCLDRTQGDFAACVRQAPTCQTDTPWNEALPCCPAACQDQFKERLRAGSSGFDAYIEVFAFDGSCVPGLSPRGE